MINRCDLCYKRNVETTRVLILSDVFNVCEECYDNEIVNIHGSFYES